MMKRENSNQPGVEGGFGIFASGAGCREMQGWAAWANG